VPGTIVSEVPEEWAFVYRVKLDDGREVQTVIHRRYFTPKRVPRVGDRVSVNVGDELSIVFRWEPLPESQAPAPNPPKD
jgi:hypothetical protein